MNNNTNPMMPDNRRPNTGLWAGAHFFRLGEWYTFVRYTGFSKMDKGGLYVQAEVFDKGYDTIKVWLNTAGSVEVE